MIDKYTRKYIEYRPTLQYIYKELDSIVNVSDTTNLNNSYIFYHNGTLASDILSEISTVQNKVNEVLDYTISNNTSAYNEYQTIHNISLLHDRYDAIDSYNDRIGDIEGTLQIEVIPILEDLKDYWTKVNDLFNGTVIALLNKEFDDDTTILEKEITLDKLVTNLTVEKNNQDAYIAQLSCTSYDSQEYLDALEAVRNVKAALEDSENLEYSKIDMCNILDLSYEKSMELLTDIDSKIQESSVETLDNDGLNVVKYILLNITPFNTNNVIAYLKKIQSSIRLSLDSSKITQRNLSDKNTFIVPVTAKNLVIDALKPLFLYRNEISTRMLHNFDDTSIVTNSTIDKFMDATIGGIGLAEDKYSKQMMDFDKISQSDLGLKQELWSQMKDKDFIRTLYIMLNSLIVYITNGGLPEISNIQSWAETFCTLYKY